MAKMQNQKIKNFWDSNISLTLLDDYRRWRDRVFADELFKAEAAGPATSAFRLEDGNQQAGYVLTSDANGNATWQSAAGSSNQTLSISGNDLTISGGNTVTLPSGGGTVSADNGLSISGGDVVLGGTLINNTTINLDDYDLIFTTGTGTFPGDIIIEGNDRTVMETNLEENYVLDTSGGCSDPDVIDDLPFDVCVQRQASNLYHLSAYQWEFGENGQVTNEKSLGLLVLCVAK